MSIQPNPTTKNILFLGWHPFDRVQHDWAAFLPPWDPPTDGPVTAVDAKLTVDANLALSTSKITISEQCVYPPTVLRRANPTNRHPRV